MFPFLFQASVVLADAAFDEGTKAPVRDTVLRRGEEVRENPNAQVVRQPDDPRALRDD
jgi:hypothetical protein